MGLLDDAIREHLELKRRHGADPSEVERQEQEALGPARRGAAPVADAEPDAGAVSVGMLDEDEDDPRAPEAVYDDEPEDEPEPSMPAGEPEAPVAPPAPPPEREPEPEREDPEAEADVAEEPAPPREAAEGEREDVLEETPDFLQETPEHDRLWFEQKPPRDFEF